MWEGRRTIDILTKELPSVIPGARLMTLFSPEHGLAGAEDKEGIGNAVDTATQLPVISLYGAKPEDRQPRIADLEKLDAVIIDLQDAVCAGSTRMNLWSDTFLKRQQRRRITQRSSCSIGLR